MLRREHKGCNWRKGLRGSWEPELFGIPRRGVLECQKERGGCCSPHLASLGSRPLSCHPYCIELVSERCERKWFRMLMMVCRYSLKAVKGKTSSHQLFLEHLESGCVGDWQRGSCSDDNTVSYGDDFYWQRWTETWSRESCAQPTQMLVSKAGLTRSWSIGPGAHKALDTFPRGLEMHFDSPWMPPPEAQPRGPRASMA